MGAGSGLSRNWQLALRLIF
jgi:hypothetical protein